jgi:hypothetical protein
MLMTPAGYGAFFFTVALLATTAYFLMGGLPLLVLKHDVPLDARFIHSFFRWYYRLAFWTSLGAGLSYAMWGRFGFAVGSAAITAATMLLRKHLLHAMQRLDDRVQAGAQGAIRDFRRVHALALSVNGVQVVVIVWGLMVLSRQMS